MITMTMTTSCCYGIDACLSVCHAVSHDHVFTCSYGVPICAYQYTCVSVNLECFTGVARWCCKRLFNECKYYILTDLF